MPLTLSQSPWTPGLGRLRPNSSHGDNATILSSRYLDSSFTEQNSAHESKTQFFPPFKRDPVPPIKKLTENSQPHPSESGQKAIGSIVSQRLKQKPYYRKLIMMKKQQVMSQKKEQDKTPGKQLDEMEIGKLWEKEFRVKIMKMIQDLGERMEAKIEKMKEMLTKDLQEQKNRRTEMNNTPEGINSGIIEAEEQINHLEDGMVEITATKENLERRMKRNEDNLKDLQDNIKHNNICIIGVPEGEEREKGPEKILEEIIAENFLHMGKKTVNQVQETQRVPGRTNLRRNTPQHIAIKLTKQLKTEVKY